MHSVNFNKYARYLIICFFGCQNISAPDSNISAKQRIIAEKDTLQNRRQLGKQLFFDRRLSRNGNLSCGTCHNPSLAFADSIPKSTGTGGHSGSRNSPSLLNVAFAPYFMSEGKVPDLEQASVVPLLDENEMNSDLKKLIANLNKDTWYKQQFKRSYNSEADTRTLVRALAAYQRSLISSGSRYDAYLKGNHSALNESEIRGLKLFHSERTSCSSCHSGLLFTDYSIVSIGLGDSDKGLMRATEKETDRGKFKTPGLRNVATTAPYMHDGSLKRLEDVLLYYNKGGNRSPGQDTRIRPLRLSEGELKDLKEFLISLNDTVSPNLVP